MKFNEMPYVRPDIDILRAESEKLSAQLKNAAAFEEADAAFSAFNDLLDVVSTNLAICYVRHTIDTRDEFYDKENDFMDETWPLLTEITQMVMRAVYDSPFRKQFEEKYGSIITLNIEMLLKAFSPEIVTDQQEENKLTSEYDKLIASAQIPFEGEEYTLSQLAPFKQLVESERRLAAWKADGGFFCENGEKLDSIYNDLVSVRDRMAKKLGYKNYVEMGYYRMNRNCYTASDVEKFRAAVIKYVVPVATRIYEEQAKRIGVNFPLSFADAALSFKSGNPKPCGTPDDILAHGKKLYHELSSQTAEFIDFMYDNELLDVLSRKGKSGGGYCIDFPKYKAPFIFANFNGTQHDVEVMTHEAGHAFAAYTAFGNNIPSVVASPSLESCEVHSMSMEFFAWNWAEGFFGDDTDKFYYEHLTGALKFIPYGTMVDHFQHIMYEKPELTPSERHDVWRELLGIYMPWIALGEDIPFYGHGKGWQRQSHIYASPFYYIDYCLAQTIALEFWSLMRHDREDAWKRYMNFVNLAGTRTFNELVEAAKLFTPFGDDALKEISAEVLAWLDMVDKEKLV